MNPSSNGPGMELPPPAVEQTPQGSEGGENARPVEKLPAAQEQGSNPSPGALPMPPSPIAIPAISSPVQFSDDSGQSDDSQPVDPKLLQDKDLIEKEWVNKAKAIIDQNREDPYKQSENMTLLKADYMKKQFNKTLKLNK